MRVLRSLAAVTLAVIPVVTVPLALIFMSPRTSSALTVDPGSRRLDTGPTFATVPAAPP